MRTILAVLTNLQLGFLQVAILVMVSLLLNAVLLACIALGIALPAFAQKSMLKAGDERSTEVKTVLDELVNAAQAGEWRDAEAAATYAQAFSRDPDFYDFYRAMQSYEQSFLSQGSAENPRGRTNIILSPDNAYLRQFLGR